MIGNPGLHAGLDSQAQKRRPCNDILDTLYLASVTFYEILVNSHLRFCLLVGFYNYEKDIVLLLERLVSMAYIYVADLTFQC